MLIDKDYIITKNFYFSILLKIIIIAVVIFIITYLLFLSTKDYTFVSDDWEIIKAALDNPFPVASDWKANDFGMYRPVVVLSFYINYLFSQYNATSYYLINLLFHFLSTVILFFIAKGILTIKLRLHPIIPFLVSGLFFILPQNLMNLFWIAGRTDLIVTFFMLSSVYFVQKFIEKNQIAFIFIAAILQLLAFLSKETAIIFIFYWLFLLIVYYKQLNKNNIISVTFAGIFLLLIYVTLRLLIFGTGLLGKQKLFEIELLSIVKYFVYGFSSLALPFDILDLLFFSNKSSYLLFILVIIGSIVIYTLIRLFISSTNKVIIPIGILLSLFSLFLYIGNYPQMRLMPAHLPLFLISISILFRRMKIKEAVLIFIFLAIVIASDIILFQRNDIIQKYNQSLMSVLPKKDEFKQDIKYYILPSLGRIGQSWVRPWPNLMLANKWGSSNVKEVNNIDNALIIETYSFTDYGDLVNFRYVDDNSFIIYIKDENGIFVPEASYKFDDDMIIKDNYPGIEVIEYSKIRPGGATSCKIKIDDSRNDIFYIWSGTKFTIFTTKDLIKWVKNENPALSR